MQFTVLAALLGASSAIRTNQAAPQFPTGSHTRCPHGPMRGGPSPLLRKQNCGIFWAQVAPATSTTPVQCAWECNPNGPPFQQTQALVDEMGDFAKGLFAQCHKNYDQHISHEEFTNCLNE